MSLNRKKKKEEDMSNQKPYTKGTITVQAIMTVAAVFFIAPIFIILNYSFKGKKELYLSSPLSLPESLNFENYMKAYKKLRHHGLGDCQV